MRLGFEATPRWAPALPRLQRNTRDGHRVRTPRRGSLRGLLGRLVLPPTGGLARRDARAVGGAGIPRLRHLRLSGRSIDGQDAPACSLVPAAETRADSPVFGQKLNLDEARRHPWLDTFWALVDWLIEHDVVRHEHVFHLPAPHWVRTPAPGAGSERVRARRGAPPAGPRSAPRPCGGCHRSPRG